MKIIISLLLLLVFSVSCNYSVEHNSQILIHKNKEVATFNPLDHVVENRNKNIGLIKQKVNESVPLIVHCFVPLCDNDHQGIVPTTTSLGDGFSTRTNLYWATSHGMKKYFQKNRYWKNLETVFETTDTILERVVFQRNFDNNAKVILVCDAYRGDMMKPCLDHYFQSLAGYRRDSVCIDSSFVQIAQAADMIAFNGHNGLMDTQIDTVYAREMRSKDAVAIACSSAPYFNHYFVQTNSYPLLTTTSLLYPGAMILDGAITVWANFGDSTEISNAAGDAYHKVKECGLEPARRMFKSGW